MEGTTLWFNPARRDGIIRTDDGERVVPDQSGFAAAHRFANRCRDTRVSVDGASARAEARVVNVAVVPPFVARRAHSRGRR